MTEQSIPQQDHPTLYPIPAWPYPWPTAGAWRHYVFDSDKNGLDEFGVLVRVGTTAKRRRILIDEGAFFRWIAAVKAGKITPEKTVYPNAGR